eukprot:g59624.t1
MIPPLNLSPSRCNGYTVQGKPLVMDDQDIAKLRYVDQSMMKSLLERPSPRWDPMKVRPEENCNRTRDDPARHQLRQARAKLLAHDLRKVKDRDNFLCVARVDKLYERDPVPLLSLDAGMVELVEA